MSTSSGGYPEEAGGRKLLKRASARISSTHSKNTSSLRSHLHSWNTKSPSPTWQKHQVTFAKGRASVSGKESPKRDAGVDKAYQMSWPTWGTEGVMHDNSDWSRTEGGEEELKCPPPLKLYLQELLSGKVPTNFNTWWPQTFPHAKCRMDMVVCSTSRHSSLVVGSVRGPLPQTPPGICTKSMCIVSSAKCMKSFDGGRQWSLCTSSPLVIGEI